MLNWIKKLFRRPWSEDRIREHVLRTASLHFHPIVDGPKHQFVHVSMEYQPRQFSGDSVLSVHFSVPPWALVLDLRAEGAGCVEHLVRTAMFIETEGMLAYRRATTWFPHTERRR